MNAKYIPTFQLVRTRDYYNWPPRFESRCQQRGLSQNFARFSQGFLESYSTNFSGLAVTCSPQNPIFAGSNPLRSADFFFRE